MCVALPDYDSEFKEHVHKSIINFSFGNYGLDNLDELKENPETNEWVLDLVTAIYKGWCSYVDGI